MKECTLAVLAEKSALRTCRLPALLCALIVAQAGIAAEPLPCRPQGGAILELRVTPGEMAASGKELRIAVHENDCVSIRMPDYYRRQGDFVLALSGVERSELERLQRALASQPYDHGRMLAEAVNLESARAAVGNAERFAVLDADHYDLIVREGAQFATRVRASGIFQYAERYPEIGSLEAAQRLMAGLIALSDHKDLVALDKSAAAEEASR